MLNRGARRREDYVGWNYMGARLTPKLGFEDSSVGVRRIAQHTVLADGNAKAHAHENPLQPLRFSIIPHAPVVVVSPKRSGKVNCQTVGAGDALVGQTVQVFVPRITQPLNVPVLRVRTRPGDRQKGAVDE